MKKKWGVEGKVNRNGKLKEGMKYLREIERGSA